MVSCQTGNLQILPLKTNSPIRGPRKQAGISLSLKDKDLFIPLRPDPSHLSPRTCFAEMPLSLPLQIGRAPNCRNSGSRGRRLLEFTSFRSPLRFEPLPIGRVRQPPHAALRA